MKYSILAILTFLLGFNLVLATEFKAGEKINIEGAVETDQYLAGEKISVRASIRGDLVAGAQSVVIEDTVFGDLLIGAGEIDVNSYIGDDARLSAGEVEINGVIEGDLVVFAGKIVIAEGAVIRGDLVAYAGELYIRGSVEGNVMGAVGEFEFEGTIGGNVEMKSGETDLDGLIGGELELSSASLKIGENAHCEGSVRYWTKDGEMDLTGFAASATYDEDLAMVEQDMDWGKLAALFGAGIIAYWIIFILSTFMILLLLEHFFGKQFDRAAQLLQSKFVLSFGYGMLYFIGIPILSIIMFVIIIGFPIGVLTLSLYLLTLLFASSIIGLTVAHYFKSRYGSDWTYFQTVAYALLTVVVLKVLFWIPFLGKLVKIVLAAGVYGAFILMSTKKAEAQV